MPKNWQEIEFLDYKERQVRRRSQKTRELELTGAAKGVDRTRLIGLSAGGALFLLALAGGIYAYTHMGQLGLMSASARSVLTVASVSGEVESSSATTGWEGLKKGTKVSSGTHIRTGKNGKVVLLPSLPKSRIVLFEDSSLMFEKIQLAAKNPVGAALTFEMERGEAAFDFQDGAPILKIVLPVVTLWARLCRFKTHISKDDNRVLVARYAVQAEDRAEPGKKTVVTENQELVSSLKEAVPKPRGAGGSSLRERWE
ncbi:MAG: hypothetical protein HYY25_07955 [Candidatus Wallbacteria bacterium]|nr:hypothetical protein [Candidatus Wallbacteria bacterium]